MKIPGCSTRMKFETFLMFPYSSACRDEAIDMLIVKIGRTVKKLLLGVFFHENSPGASLE